MSYSTLQKVAVIMVDNSELVFENVKRVQNYQNHIVVHEKSGRSTAFKVADMTIMSSGPMPKEPVDAPEEVLTSLTLEKVAVPAHVTSGRPRDSKGRFLPKSW